MEESADGPWVNLGHIGGATCGHRRKTPDNPKAVDNAWFVRTSPSVFIMLRLRVALRAFGIKRGCMGANGNTLYKA